jgi:hypothetical protein
MFDIASSFEEKCAASWAELVANPIIRHEISLPKPLFGSPLPSTGSELGGWEHEPFDVSFNLLAIIGTAKQPQTDPA